MDQGGWVPIDKTLVFYLPTNREYSEVEAMFVLQVDFDKGVEKSERHYSQQWGWGRTRVRNFLKRVKRTTTEPQAYHPDTGKKPPARIIINRLGGKRSHRRTTSVPPPNHKRTTSLILNPKTENKKGRTLPLDFRLTEEMTKWAAEKNITLNLDWEIEKFKNKFIGSGTVDTNWSGRFKNWLIRGMDYIKPDNGQLQISAVRAADVAEAQKWEYHKKKILRESDEDRKQALGKYMKKFREITEGAKDGKSKKTTD